MHGPRRRAHDARPGPPNVAMSNLATILATVLITNSPLSAQPSVAHFSVLLHLLLPGPVLPTRSKSASFHSFILSKAVPSFLLQTDLWQVP